MATNKGTTGKAPMPKFIKNMKKATLTETMDMRLGGKSKKGATITRRPGYNP